MYAIKCLRLTVRYNKCEFIFHPNYLVIVCKSGGGRREKWKKKQYRERRRKHKLSYR